MCGEIVKMNKREFNLILRRVSVAAEGDLPPRLSLPLLEALPAPTREAMLRFVVRGRGPVLAALVTPETDMAWLHACGYLHRFESAGFQFIGTAEHSILDRAPDSDAVAAK